MKVVAFQNSFTLVTDACTGSIYLSILDWLTDLISYLYTSTFIYIYIHTKDLIYRPY